jgi:hypothetical protein
LIAPDEPNPSITSIRKMGHIKNQREAKPSHIYGEGFFVIIAFVFKCNSIPMKEIKTHE